MSSRPRRTWDALISRPDMELNHDDFGWGPVPTTVHSPGDPDGEPIGLDWPRERDRWSSWAMLLVPLLLGVLAATVAVVVLDVDAGIGSDTWALLAGAGVLLGSTLLAMVLMLARAITWLRDRLGPDRVEGVVVLVAVGRPRGGDGSSEQQSHYLAVYDGSRPVAVHHSSEWLNRRVRVGDRAVLIVGPRRRRVLKVP
jgi:hypothetical protein